MLLMSFNVNGIRARLHQMEVLLKEHQPDVIGLQEVKVVDEQFPREDLEALGYHVETFGQKAHYGVALLSRRPPNKVWRGFPGDGDKAQRRMIGAQYEGPEGTYTVLNGYFPQGSDRAHPTKFPAKEAFYCDLNTFLNSEFSVKEPLALMGDFNIAPLDSDIGIGENNAKRWLRDGKCSFLPEERAWYQRLLEWGFEDSYRRLHPQVNDRFSWFDYRSRGFDDDPKRGLRIDHILLTPILAEQVVAAGIDYEVRAMDKPSDHCPVWVRLES